MDASISRTQGVTSVLAACKCDAKPNRYSGLLFFFVLSDFSGPAKEPEANSCRGQNVWLCSTSVSLSAVIEFGCHNPLF